MKKYIALVYVFVWIACASCNMTTPPLTSDDLQTDAPCTLGYLDVNSSTAHFILTADVDTIWRQVETSPGTYSPIATNPVVDINWDCFGVPRLDYDYDYIIISGTDTCHFNIPSLPNNF